MGTIKRPASKKTVKPISKLAVKPISKLAVKPISSTSLAKSAGEPIKAKAAVKTSTKAIIKKTTAPKKTTTTKQKAVPEPVLTPKLKTQAKSQSSKKGSSKRKFTSNNAMMSFWQETIGVLQDALGNETTRKTFQNNLATLMQDIPKEGFSVPDARLKSDAWQSDPFYAQLTQIYGYQSAITQRMVKALPINNTADKRKIQFLANQMIDAFSPANFAWSNPEFINKALQTKGESLVDGMNHLIADVQKGRITHVDESKFVIGENIATTPGKIILRTPLFELIEYAPQTKKIAKQALLFVPPCINKFYIMDLSQNNSLVRFAVEQGHHLYLISWRNINSETQMVEWDHYVGSVISAINTVREDNNGENCNVLGFCVGGTILSTALSVMAAKGLQLPVSTTLLTTLLDFSEPGDLGVFLSEALLRELEEQADEGGVVLGSSLAQVFSTLRPRDLVWNYVTQKYLKGEKPRDFDILYWNGDSTNLGVRMLAWYLRQCYIENALVKKSAVVLGEKVDLSKISTPIYFYASRDDHIVPWPSAYNSARAIGDKTEIKRFVLGASGHIAGVINPAAANRRNYWLGKQESSPIANDCEKWMAETTEHKGSWWNDWNKWMAQHKGGEVASSSLSYHQKKADAAPGEYILERADNEDDDEIEDNPTTAWLETYMSMFQHKR